VFRHGINFIGLDTGEIDTVPQCYHRGPPTSAVPAGPAGADQDRHLGFSQIWGLLRPLRRDVLSHWVSHGASRRLPPMTLPRGRHNQGCRITGSRSKHRPVLPGATSAASGPSQRWGVPGTSGTMACLKRRPPP
jgi:hypothetical protein